MKKAKLIVLMVLGLTFGSVASKAQTTSISSTTSQTTEASAQTNNLLASTVETKTSVSNNSPVTAKPQKPHHPKKKDWADRSLGGKILIIIGGTLFVLLCLMYGTVSVG